jgi:hypothetical protein
VGVKRILVVLLALLALPVAGAAVRPPARVAVTDRVPLTVRGTGFADHERVLVRVEVGTRLSRRTTATAAGRFVVTWPAAAAPKAGCVGIRVRAAGNRGSVATVKIPGIECPQGPTDPSQ